MDKHAAALVLSEIGTLMELHGENRFRARAFQSAARAVESLDGALDELVRTDALDEVRGLGPATAGVVRELVEAGQSSLHRELRDRTPDGLIELLGIPGLGARRIHTLHDALGVESLDELERAAREGRVAEVAGFGAKSQEKLLDGIAFLRATAGRRRLPDALGVAGRLLSLLREHPAVERAEVGGAVRRRNGTAGTVEIVAVAADRAASVLDAFLGLPGVTRGERVGETAARARLADGFELRLRCVAPDSFVAAWLAATGSEDHVRALAERAGATGLRLDEYGLWDGNARIQLDDEAAIYERLGLSPVPPELREGTGEVDAAAAAELPDLIETEELRGCFHCHTEYSDGKATLEEMAEAARARGWRYLGIADHSRAAAYAGGLSVEAIERQHEAIDAWNDEHGGELWLFKGIEADILPDGRLDYAEDGDVLARFDYVVGSIHSAFGLSESDQTARVLHALEDPHLTFLGHPTGRLLLAREGFALDLEAVIDAAAEHGVGIEINSNPRRLELDWRYWRRASARGVRTAINPDAHSVPELDYVRYGIDVARKGWLTADEVVNAWPLDRVRDYLTGR